MSSPANAAPTRWNGRTEPVAIADENLRRSRHGLAPLIAVDGVWYVPGADTAAAS